MGRYSLPAAQEQHAVHAPLLMAPCSLLAVPAVAHADCISTLLLQSRWEEDLHGFPVHLPPTSSAPGGTLCSSSSGGGGGPGNAAQQPALMISLLGPPADAPSGQLWPPNSPAGTLLCLGPRGLSQLQVLDASAATGVAALAEVLAAHCRQAVWCLLGGLRGGTRRHACCTQLP